DLREIGHGSFGAVYYARCNLTKEIVAIKKMSYLGKQSEEKWQDILKEIKFLKQLEHPNTIEYKGCYKREHTAWLVMEYCVHKRPLREEEIAAICEGVVSGLSYLHSLGRIHRDIKAGNILLTEQGTVKLADFGSASIKCPANSFVGTPYWMAPELAERKPPYFNMNAMSALYHIAQNESPPLQVSYYSTEAPEWTDTFRYFVEACLQKNPQDRPTSTKLLSHPFITRPRSPNVLVDLIQRTKAAVRDLDNLNYRKMKKILMVDGDNESAIGETKAAVRDLDNLNYRKMKKILMVDGDNESAIGDSEEAAEERSGGDSSKSNSATSEHSAAGASSQSSSSGSLRRRPHPVSTLKYQHVNHQHAAHVVRPAEARKRWQWLYSCWCFVRRETESPVSTHDDYVNREAVREYANRDSRCDDYGDDYANREAIREAREREREREWQANDYRDNNVSAAMSVVSEHGANNFATIRTTSIVTKQQKEHNQEMHEQMSGYKRMRREHQAALMKLEERCKADVDAHKAQLDREYDALLQQLSRDLERLQNAAAEKKLIKDITARQEQDRKAFEAQRKREYKANKERWKKELSMDDATPKRQRDATLQSQKDSLKQAEAAEEGRLVRSQREYLELELRRFRRRRMLAVHHKEQELLRERAEHELRKKHALQLKQQPKSLKSKSKMQAEAQRNRERRELEERVAVRRALLEQKMESECAHALAIAEGSRDGYGDEEQSLSGSMLSLAHSNSSASFAAGSL
ncbi:Serine/threonine protein kinase, partial [Operophtera brumata]